MELIERYEALVAAERWSEALLVIEEIVSRAPDISTSWFNRGVCLDALSRPAEAATQFLKAYALNPTDFGAQYRAFRALALAHDFQRFMALVHAELSGTPEVIELLASDPVFAEFTSRPEFQALSRPQQAIAQATLGQRLARFFRS